MAAPVEPSPTGEDDTGEDDACAAEDLATWGPEGWKGREGRDWIDDELWLEIQAELDAAADPAPGPGEPGWAVPGVGGGGVGGVGERGEGGLSAASVAELAETAAAVTTLRLAQARVYRALSALEAGDAVAESGYRYISRLLTDHVRLDPGEATRLARHARALSPGTSPTGAVIPAALPATAGLVTDGTIGPGHVEVLRRTMTRLERVDPPIEADTLATTESELAGLAAILTPSGLADAAAVICARLDPDGTAPDDDPPPENELHYLRRRDGSLVGKFRYGDPAAAETLHTALAAATPPADVPEPAPGEREGTGSSHAASDAAGHAERALAERTLAERRAHALLDLAGEALTRGLNTPDHNNQAAAATAAGPQDDAAADAAAAAGPQDGDAAGPQHGDAAGAATTGAQHDEGPAATPAAASPAAASPAPPAWTRADVEGGEPVALTLTLNYETLRQALTDPALTDAPLTAPGDGYTGRLALLGENTWIRPETARRLACDAEVIPLVLGSRGEPLDLGRKNRVATAALRRALTHRDRHCAHPGCRRRARRCHAHHVRHWIDLGQTCPENCVLLCTYHHTLIHHSDWQIHMIDGLPWFTPPAFIDPHRRPRHNRPWQPAEPTVA